MKIGILTFHCAHNYGAVLQCYAMQEFLRSKGHDVEVINYRPKYLLEPYKIFNLKRCFSKNPFRILERILKEFILLPMRIKRFHGFENFINSKLNLSNAVTKKYIPSNYDIYIVGSDQIWNPKITRGFDDIYFCRFPFVKEKKKYIAYAASMESKVLDDNAARYYSYSLNNFDYISVREKQLLELLQPLVHKPIEQVLDPTLMVSSKIWEIFPNRNNQEKYVVVYQVRNNENTIRIAHHIAAQIGAKVKILVAWLQIKYSDTDQNATPEEFVDYIRNASCVVTTSFHGSAFSIIFNRPFYTIRLNDGADTRSSSLLKSLGLEHRMIDANESPVFSQIDYSLVNQRLDVLRVKSQNYLLNSLQYE